MRIPTILADENAGNAPAIPTINVTPAKDYSGAGMAAVGEAIGNLGDVFGKIGVYEKEIAARRQREIDESWIGKQISSTMRDLADWQVANPETETYAKDLDTFTQKKVDEYAQGAPSPNAAREYRDRMRTHLTPIYAQATVAAEKVRISNARESLVGQVKTAIDVYRSTYNLPNSMAAQTIATAHAETATNIDRIFGKIAPQQARQLQAYNDAETALAVAREHPGFAKALVEASTNIDETDKPALYGQISRLSESGDLQRAYDFTQVRRDIQAQVTMGRPVNLPDKSAYVAAYGKDRGGVEYSEDQAIVRRYTKYHKLAREISPMAAASQEQELAKFAKSVKGDEDLEVLKLLTKRVRDNQEQQVKDPVAFLRENNPMLRDMQQIALEEKDPKKLPALQAKLNAMLKSYQGSPPPGQDSPYYLGLPSGAVRLMSDREAELSAAHINSGTPEEVVTRMNQLFANRFTTADDIAIAFRDMAALPSNKAVRQEYQAIWHNKDEWWVGTLVRALGDKEAMVRLTDERRSELDKNIETNASWKKFVQAAVGPHGERAETVAGFRGAIQVYANYIHTVENRKISDAAKEAIDRIIESTMGFTSVNGVPLVLPRARDNMPPMTDEDMVDVGRRLGMLLSTAPVQNIDQSNMPQLGEISADPNSVERLQALRDTITEHGYFVIDGDGKSAALYVPGVRGIPVPIRDKERQQLRVAIEDLPLFVSLEEAPEVMHPGTEMSLQVKRRMNYVKERPLKKYPLLTPTAPGFIDQLLGTTQYRTNWPSGVGWGENKFK